MYFAFLVALPLDEPSLAMALSAVLNYIPLLASLLSYRMSLYKFCLPANLATLEYFL